DLIPRFKDDPRSLLNRYSRGVIGRVVVADQDLKVRTLQFLKAAIDRIDRSRDHLLFIERRYEDAYSRSVFHRSGLSFIGPVYLSSVRSGNLRTLFLESVFELVVVLALLNLQAHIAAQPDQLFRP